MTMDGDESFDWAGLVPAVVHPLKVAIIEALAWIGEPLSPSELKEVFERQFSISLIAYHVNKLADTGAIRAVKTRQVRGARQTFYFFTAAR
jgi:hypothetical protein